MKNKQLTLVVFICASFICASIISIKCDFLLSVNIVNYTNPTGLCAECEGTTPVCCDEFPFKSGNCTNTGEERCDTRFRWTIRSFGDTLGTRPPSAPNANSPANYFFTNCAMSPSTCPFSEMSSTFDQGPTAILGVTPNPLPVSNSTFVWTGRIQFFIEAVDSGLPNIIDSLLIDLDNLQLGANFTEEMTFTGFHNLSHMTMSFRVECSPGFCGPDCTTHQNNTRVATCQADGTLTCNDNRFDPSPFVACNDCLYNLDITTECSTCLNNKYDPTTKCRLCIDSNFNPIDGCTSCMLEFYDTVTNCTQCLPNRDPSTNCTQCLPNRDPSTNCTQCLPNRDPSTDCIQCLPNRDPSTDCTQCLPNRDSSTNCTQCLPNRDPSTDCTQCLPNRDPSTNCTQCLPGWDITSDCISCLPNRDPGTNCSLCVQPDRFTDTDCSVCALPGGDPATHCQTCLDNFNPNCTECVANYDLNTRCSSCLYGYDTLSGCSVCLPGRKISGTNCEPDTAFEVSLDLVCGIIGGVVGALLIAVLVTIVVIVLTLRTKRRGNKDNNIVIDAGKSQVRSKAPILESEAIPLQPIPRYGVRANVDSTADYEFVETPIHMKKNPVYDVITVDSTADYEIVETPIHMKKNPVDVSTTVDSTADYEIVETPIHKKNPVDVSTTVDSTADYEIVETPIHKKNPVDVSTTVDSTADYEIVETPIHKKNPVDVSTTVDSTADFEIVETTHINWKQNPVYDATTQRQLQPNLVHRALNDEQISQVENEGLGTPESPQQFEYDYDYA